MGEHLPCKQGVKSSNLSVSSAVPSAVCGLTIVFGMGTGVSRRRIATKKLEFLARSPSPW